MGGRIEHIPRNMAQNSRIRYALMNIGGGEINVTSIPPEAEGRYSADGIFIDYEGDGRWDHVAKFSNWQEIVLTGDSNQPFRNTLRGAQPLSNALGSVASAASGRDSINYGELMSITEFREQLRPDNGGLHRVVVDGRRIY